MPVFTVEPMLELCGNTTTELDYIRNNLYFVLDSSGSMTQDIAGTDSLTRFEAAQTSIIALLEQVGHRVNYGATAFPGLGGECNAGREIHRLQAGDNKSYALRGSEGPVLGSFMDRIQGVEPAGGTPTAATLERVYTALRNKAGSTFVFLITDGAPNCNVDAECESEACIPNIESWPDPAGGTCGQPNNCCENGGQGNCLDSDPTLEAVTALSDAGIDTFVIGIPGSATYSKLLDNLAVAGGRPRDARPYYYSVENSDELADVLLGLGQDVSLECNIRLATEPQDRDLINVLFDEVPVPFDEEDGWTWVNADTIEIVGKACELIEQGQVSVVDIREGCPAITVR